MPVPLTREQLGAVLARFGPERPGPVIAQHVVATGHGGCLADRWPDPRALLAESGGNYALAGDPDALDPDDLASRVTGFVDAPAAFVPLLRRAFDDPVEWPRMVLALEGPPRPAPPAGTHPLRRLGPGDAAALAGLGEELGWITKTWGGPAGLAAAGTAWGAFADERLVAVACPFFVGAAHEDLGVVSDPAFRGLGLSPACAGALCHDVRRRGRVPTWTTSPDNTASLRVAAKLGFRLRRRDRLLVVGVPVPAPARSPGR